MSLKNSARKTAQLLTFQISQDELKNLNRDDLYFGLFVTWIVGMGRYWDDPGALFLQKLGVGSLVYIGVLTLFLWIVVWPFKVKDLKYENMLTFISLTSLPALLYAIPVERFLDFGVAASLNAWFLTVVAVWRVALLIFFFRRLAEFSKTETTVLTFLPLTALVATLSALNLERAVFQIMGGLRSTTNDMAYLILQLLTLLAMVLVIPFFLSYCLLIYRKTKLKI